MLIDYTTSPGGAVDIDGIYLIDIENALPVKRDHFMYNMDIGHRFWRSPEAHARRMIGKPTDIFSFGLIVSFSAERILIGCLLIMSRSFTSFWEENTSS